MDEGIAELWVKGGWPMYLLTLLLFAELPLSVVLPVVALAKPSRAWLLGFILIVVGVGTQASGYGVQALLMRGVDAALTNVNPKDVELIRMVAQTEVAVPRVFALLVGLLPLSAGIFTVGIGMRGEGEKRRPIFVTLGAVAAALVFVSGLYGLQMMWRARAELEQKANAAIEAKAPSE